MSTPSLDQWLVRLEQQHPVTIDLGLDRIRQVADRLGLKAPAATVVSVAGTNGKGSVVRTLEDYLVRAGRRVGAYSSPHLVHYNERIRIDGVAVADGPICDAFARIEAARGDITLTYFEAGTLAALLIMADSDLDVAVLEVGLGGRCDAVNLVDADIAVITSIALDHTDWLGDSRDAIAREKAGIARQGCPVFCADEDPPQALRSILGELDCPVGYLGTDYSYTEYGDGTLSIELRLNNGQYQHLNGLPLPGLPVPSAVTALQVAAVLDGGLDPILAGATLANATLPGRFQRVQYRSRQLVLDVAHNPAAAGYLAARLQVAGLVPDAAVAAIMADKDAAGFVQALDPLVAHWYVGELPGVARSLPAQALAGNIGAGKVTVAGDIGQAFEAAIAAVPEGGVVLVCGSFVTVGAILEIIGDGNP